TKLSDFLTFDYWGNDEDIAVEYLQRNGIAVATNSRGLYYINGAPTTLAYTGPSYSIPGTANAANPVVNVRFKLGMLYHTLFELDKDLPFNQSLNLRIKWSPITR